MVEFVIYSRFVNYFCVSFIIYDFYLILSSALTVVSLACESENLNFLTETQFNIEYIFRQSMTVTALIADIIVLYLVTILLFLVYILSCGVQLGCN